MTDQPRNEEHERNEENRDENHETKQDLLAEEALLAKAVGGWRGMIDSALPSVVFIVAYVGLGLLPQYADVRLKYSLIAAVGIGVVIAILRILRKQPLQQVLAGFVGVAVSAFVAARTGNAEDYFLPGILLNVGYFAAFLISILIRWPLVGVIVGLLTKGNMSWREDQQARRTYAAASWLWVGVFGLRLAVQVPLYLAGAVAPLGVLKILMGWPLYLAALYFTYRVVAPLVKAQRSVSGQ